MTQFLARATSTDDSSIYELEPSSSVIVLPESKVTQRTRRYVLLVDTTGERLAWMEQAVGESRLCLKARTDDEAVQFLNSCPVDLILAASSACTTDFLNAVAARGLSRSCVFLASAAEVEHLSEAYSAQHTFRVLSSDQSIETVHAFLQSVLYPREQVRRTLTGTVAELTPAGREVIPCAVLDISNRGIAVRVDAEHELLLPGTRIAKVALYQAGARLLDDVSAVVRYVEMIAPASGEGLAYKVGLELRAPVSRAEGTDILLAEPTRILSLLREGLARGPLSIALADANDNVSLSRRATVAAKARELLVEGSAPVWLEGGDIVECRFEFSGSSYSFLASVTRTDAAPESGLALRIPRALRVVRQRRSVRIRPGEDEALLLTPWSPFTGQLAPRRAVNITASGAAFVVSGRDELLPLGTHLPRLALRFPDGGELTCQAMVRALVPGTRAGDMVCGVEFLGLEKAERSRIAEAIVNAGRPELQDGTGTSFADLWHFFLDTRFLYPEKLASLDEPAIERTMTALLSRSNDILKTSLFVKSGRIEGHASGVHTYRKTWSLQHLAARVTGKSTMTRGRLLNLAVIEYLEQLPDIEWIKIWYRPTNKWPARVFGGYARKLADPSLSHHRTYGYTVSKTNVPYAADPGVTVRAATASDHPRIESHFVAAREEVLLRSDDLTSAHLSLSELSRLYGEMGLERRREVLVAERAGRFAGFALLEVSSPGLNFSELTNTFRVFSPEGDVRARRALVARARERYRELGHARAIALTDEAELDAFELHGFEKVKEYACWTWHRSECQGFLKHVLKLRV